MHPTNHSNLINNNANNSNSNSNKIIEKPQMNFASLCFLTSGVRVLDKDKLEPHESSVLCEASGSHVKSEYYFDHVINGKPEIVNTYKKYISPLIEQTIAGKSCVLLANSVPKNDFSPYFVGDEEKPSILISIVNQLLHFNNNNNNNTNKKNEINNATVTFSWYKINCDKGETIIDVLREASGPQNNNNNNDKNKKINNNNNNNNDLLLREIGRGRGMTVSGLWEVELSNSSDIEAVINHVLQVYSEGDNITKSHSIFQFVYTPKNIKDKNNKDNKSSPASKSILAGQQDATGVGRFNFIVLSSLSSYDYNTLALAKIAHHPMLAFEHEWISKLKNIIDWIHSDRPSPPFHKSRLVLLLRDLLCGRQPCILLQCIDKFIPNNGHQANATRSEIVSINDMMDIYFDNIHRWFQMMASIAHTRDSKLVVGNPFIYDNNTNNNNNTNNTNNNNIINTTMSKINTVTTIKPPVPPEINNKSELIIKKTSKISTTNTSTINNNKIENNNKENNNKLLNVEKRSTSTIKERIPSRSSTPELNDAELLKNTLKTKLNSNNNTNNNNNNVNDIVPSWTNVSPNPPPPPPGLKTTIDIIPMSSFGTTIDNDFQPIIDDNINLDIQLNQNNNNINLNNNNNNITNLNNNNNKPMRRKSTIVEVTTNNKTQVDEFYRPIVSDADKHTIQLLTKALDDNKKELQLLTIELDETKNKYETCRTAYELLVDTIKQEGSMLKQKDRENYHKALRDLKDYSIYKEVVEAAMVRLQNELDAVLLENKNLREESEKNLKNMRKKLSTSQRYDHYATNVYKKYTEAENVINTTEQEKKKLQKEKEQLQELLTHCKLQLQDMKDKYENEENQLNYNNLLTRVNEYENIPNFKKVFGIHKKKLSLIQNNNNNQQQEDELNSLRQAHTKALEKIMTLQEENDEMRQALIELVPEDKEFVEIAKSTLKS